MLATRAGDDHQRAAVSGLPTSTLGRTGIRVTKLGFGAMELRRRLDPAAVERLLHGVLDAGINLIDTAPDYGRSEEHIGSWLSHRRDEFFLASKCGCPVGRPDPPPGQRREHFFDRANVRAGVEQSLRRMQTDRLDLVQFHNNPTRSTLEANDSVAELLTLRDEGKIRFLGMSGTLPNLADHIEMGVFDVFQVPYSAVDRKHEGAISDVAGREPARSSGAESRKGCASPRRSSEPRLPTSCRTCRRWSSCSGSRSVTPTCTRRSWAPPIMATSSPTWLPPRREACPPMCTARQGNASSRPRLQSAAVTRRNVAGMEVASLLGLLFCPLKRASNSFCRSAARPFASAASNAFMVGP